MYHVMDLCTGIGGFSLALKWLVGGFRTVCYVEIDKYCQQLIQARIKDGYLDDAPIWSDLKTFDGRPWRGSVDIITAGFPCQPFSVAGKRQGEKDERNLWPDLWRVCCEVRPSIIFLENVPAILAHKYMQRIFGNLAEGGYDSRWRILSAAEVGAAHKRDRLWIVADSKSARWSTWTSKKLTWRCSKVADTESARLENRIPYTWGSQARQPRFKQASWWTTEPDVGRVAHGVSARVHRLKGLGNAVVPAVVAKAWEILKP
jgi:DNA (cytosine-5)-methyltransferase 1